MMPNEEALEKAEGCLRRGEPIKAIAYSMFVLARNSSNPTIQTQIYNPIVEDWKPHVDRGTFDD